MCVFLLAFKWYFICHCIIIISQVITQRKKVTDYRDVYISYSLNLSLIFRIKLVNIDFWHRGHELDFQLCNSDYNTTVCIRRHLQRCCTDKHVNFNRNWIFFSGKGGLLFAAKNSGTYMSSMLYERRSYKSFTLYRYLSCMPLILGVCAKMFILNMCDHWYSRVFEFINQWNTLWLHCFLYMTSQCCNNRICDVTIWHTMWSPQQTESCSAGAAKF